VPTRTGAQLTVDARRLFAVQALRAFAYGLGSVLIGVTLERRGLSSVAVGVVLAALLAGAALTSALLARFGDRFGRRQAYLLLLVVMAAAGTVFALTDSVPALVIAALTGTISTDVVESGPFTSLEQVMLPHAAGERSVTRLFGAYNVVATLAGSLGALAAGLPSVLGSEPQRWLLVYPLAAAAGIVAARRLSAEMEVDRRRVVRRAPLHRSRRMVVRLSALFALDSFGGGFVVQTFIAYWFTREWGTAPATLGIVFFAVGILQTVSFHAAVGLAERIGLLRTMVFTHLPSNLLLAAIPFAPSARTAIAFLLARFTLSQMDVPARQAYVVGVVDADERTAAAGYTSTARHAVRPLAPLAAGPLLQLSLAAPFLAAGVLKSVYDLGLYVLFRNVADPQPDLRPPPAGSVT
jgi:MFS family permease